MRALLVIALLGGCRGKAAEHQAAPVVVHDAATLTDEAVCRAISNGRSCAEIEPELAKLRADTARYMDWQFEVSRLSSTATDATLPAAERRAACERLFKIVAPSESNSILIPGECLRR